MSLRLVKSAARAALRANEIVAGWALRPVLFREWKRPYLVGINERPLEYRFAFDAILRCAPKDLLDVGPGQSAFPSLVAESGVLVTALDKVDEYWTGAFVNRHYHVVRDDITRPKLGRQFDMVTCLSVLEHIPEHEAAMRGMFSLLRPGGHVVLTIPYADRAYHPDVYRAPGALYGADYPFIAQMYSRAELDRWLALGPATVVAQEYWEAFSGDLWAHGERYAPPRAATREGRHQMTCLLLRKDSG